MTKSSRRWIVGIGMAAILFTSSPLVNAAPHPSLKMQIVAPECTLDVIDDGLGPIEVITCPPGVIDPDPDPNEGTNGGTGNGTGNNATDGVGDGEVASFQVSQRLQSVGDSLVLLEMLKDSGMTIELPGGGTLSPTHSDVITKSKDDNSTVIETSLVSIVVVAAATMIIGTILYFNGSLAALTQHFSGSSKKK
jgi:hypothetical protein